MDSAAVSLEGKIQSLWLAPRIIMRTHGCALRAV